MSLPTRKSGLKYIFTTLVNCYALVSSYAEEWIEMFIVMLFDLFVYVSSYAEEWIEIYIAILQLQKYFASLPTRKSGLKSMLPLKFINLIFVSSYAEEWIEIYSALHGVVSHTSLFLRGRVD